jgi:glycosyltransferase involved in cell wall biosynthesis
MFKNKKISLILPVYNEAQNIIRSIKEIESLNLIDEIIAVDNNSDDKSEILIKKTKAKYFLEKKQGYGAAICCGLKNSTGDFIITYEPDNSFDFNDIPKLLRYTDEFDCVFGTRTNKKYIKKNAKMNFGLRHGNIIVAKMLSILFLNNNFTDVGCTSKVISRKFYEMIKNNLTVTGSENSPEIMINLIIKKAKIVEIPVTYKERIGKSKITKDFFATALVAFKMIILIIKLRIKYFIKK